jgi:hypothetical protein
VSAYVHPRTPANSLPGQVIATFYALPAGEDPVASKADDQGMGGVQDDGSHPQITLLLESSGDSSPGSAPLAGLGVSTQVEKGDDNGSKGPAAPAPPAGQGEILVGTGPVTSLQTGSLGLYLISGSSSGERGGGWLTAAQPTRVLTAAVRPASAFLASAKYMLVFGLA